MRTPSIDHQADALITTAFQETQITKAERLTQLGETGLQLNHLVGQNWDPTNSHLVSSLRAGSFLACMPSLVAVTKSEPHTKAIALEVSQNFKAFSRQLVRDGFLNRAFYAEHQTSKQHHLTGQIGEIAVLGLIWWGAAHGHLPDNTYALPATRQQDGKHLKEGYSLASDIILKKSGSKGRQLVQVKNRLRAHTHRINGYHEDVAIVAVEDLLSSQDKDRPGNGPKKVLHMLAYGQTDKLTVASRQLARVINRPSSQAAKPSDMPKSFNSAVPGRRPRRVRH